MSYSAKIILDSINTSGNRLTTFEIELPKFLQAEINTHRIFSRNSASSRAIPATKFRDHVAEDPVIPVFWGKNQKGMQASEEISDPTTAEEWWLAGMRMMYNHHKKGEELGLHKQIVNRIIEPWMFTKIIISATDYENFFHLRCHKDAQPEIKRIADKMQELYRENKPTLLSEGEWHLPYWNNIEWPSVNYSTELAKKISVARCARVSYLPFGLKRDLNEDYRLHDQLLVREEEDNNPIHASPAEHQAMALKFPERIGNFIGWHQYRKDFQNESGIKAV